MLLRHPAPLISADPSLPLPVKPSPSELWRSTSLNTDSKNLTAVPPMLLIWKLAANLIWDIDTEARANKEEKEKEKDTKRSSITTTLEISSQRKDSLIRKKDTTPLPQLKITWSKRETSQLLFIDLKPMPPCKVPPFKLISSLLTPTSPPTVTWAKSPAITSNLTLPE